MAFQWGPLSEQAYRSIVESQKRMNIWEGAVRSSKTIASIIRWIDFVQNAPGGGVLMMVGKTSKTLKRNIIDVIIDMVGEKNARLNRGTGTFYLFDKEIDCLGAIDERAQEKIRGATVAGCYGDELSLWPESFFKMMLSRLSVRGAKLFGTTNPDSPYHWLKVEFIDRAKELDIAVFHFVLEDNRNLPPEYIEALKKEYTGLWKKRFIDGLWVMADGVIHDTFNEEIHAIDVPALLERQKRQRFASYITACDYGTNNPMTFGLYGYDRKPPVYLVKEYYWDSNKHNRQKTDSEYADDWIDFIGDIRPVANYIDPSAASFIAEMTKRGIQMTGAKNDVVPGIRWVSGMLGANQFFVDKSCRDTIREYLGYVWDPKAQKRGEDAPLKENDHAMDRDRYALFSHFWRAGHKVIGFNFK